MSRSFKKVVVYKLKNDSFFKKLYNKKIRKAEVSGKGNLYRKLGETWDICDFRTNPVSKKELLKQENSYRYVIK